MEGTNEYVLVAKRNLNFKPIKFRIKGKDHFQVFLSIKSDSFDPTLSKVSFVQYELHSSFKERFRVSKNPQTNFNIEIKTWGTFVVKFHVHLKDGIVLSFNQDYSQILENIGL